MFIRTKLVVYNNTPVEFTPGGQSIGMLIDQHLQEAAENGSVVEEVTLALDPDSDDWAKLRGGYMPAGTSYPIDPPRGPALKKNPKY